MPTRSGRSTSGYSQSYVHRDRRESEIHPIGALLDQVVHVLLVVVHRGQKELVGHARPAHGVHRRRIGDRRGVEWRRQGCQIIDGVHDREARRRARMRSDDFKVVVRVRFLSRCRVDGNSDHRWIEHGESIGQTILGR